MPHALYVCLQDEDKIVAFTIACPHWPRAKARSICGGFRQFRVSLGTESRVSGTAAGSWSAQVNYDISEKGAFL